MYLEGEIEDDAIASQLAAKGIMRDKKVEELVVKVRSAEETEAIVEVEPSINDGSEVYEAPPYILTYDAREVYSLYNYVYKPLSDAYNQYVSENYIGKSFSYLNNAALNAFNSGVKAIYSVPYLGQG